MIRDDIHFVFVINQSFHWFIIGLFFPILILVQLDKGLNLLEVGVTAAIYSATVILLELPTGGLSDSIGRKRVYLISVVVQIISYLLILISWNFITMAFAFLAFGVARALSSGSMDAWFVDEFNRAHPEGNLQKSLAKVGVFIPLGLAAASIIGGVMPMIVGPWFEQIPGFNIYSGNLVLMVLLAIIQFFLTSALVFEHGEFIGKASDGFKKLPEILSTSIMYGARNPVIKILLMATVAAGFGFAGLELLWQPRVEELIGVDSQTWIYGVLAAGYFLMGSLGNAISASLSEKMKGRLALSLVGMRGMMGLLMLALALQGDILGFAFFYLVTFAFNGLSSSPHSAIFNSQVPAAKRSTLLSFESLILQVGFMTGSLAMGVISNSVSISAALMVSAMILTGSCVLYLILSGWEKKGNWSAETRV
ncbi:MAG: MFS transporter [Methanomassiliicoccales archaeon]|nr:MFS transporter [Methanomassiliicoccales archaeon]NYT15621.1 MFS transporter [Methanomassiliicoccales archaeon]